MPLSKGLFITFEGGEGAGKSTQVQKLADALKSKGYDVVITREPGGTPAAEAIRDLFARSDADFEWTPMAECLLVFTAREMHVQELIKPALAQGKIVICDRFTESTFAYQGYGHGVPLEKIENINEAAIDGFTPDLTLILDMPVDVGVARAKSRLADDGSNEDRFENMKLDFHNKMRQGFLDIAAQNTQRCKIVDAAGSIEDVAQEINAAVTERLEEHG